MFLHETWSFALVMRTMGDKKDISWKNVSKCFYFLCSKIEDSIMIENIFDNLPLFSSNYVLMNVFYVMIKAFQTYICKEKVTLK